MITVRKNGTLSSWVKPKFYDISFWFLSGRESVGPPARDGDHGHVAPSVPANICAVEGFACDAKLEWKLRAGLGADGSELAVMCGIQQRRPQPETEKNEVF